MDATGAVDAPIVVDNRLEKKQSHYNSLDEWFVIHKEIYKGQQYSQIYFARLHLMRTIIYSLILNWKPHIPNLKYYYQHPYWGRWGLACLIQFSCGQHIVGEYPMEGDGAGDTVFISPSINEIQAAKAPCIGSRDFLGGIVGLNRLH